MTPQTEAQAPHSPLKPGLPALDAPLVSKFQAWRLPLILCGLTVITTLLVHALRGLGQELDYADIVQAIHATSARQLGLAVLATGVSFLALTGYDWSALKYVGIRVAWPIVSLTAFIAYALGNTLGVGVLTGGAVRMRILGAAGVSVADISRVIAFGALAFGLGLTTVGACALLWNAHTLAHLLHLGTTSLRFAASVILLMAVLFVGRCAFSPELQVRHWHFRLPGASLALRQLLISGLDIAASAAVLWVLLPGHDLAYPQFLALYAAAVLLGVISHVPGGLGVFETVMVLGLRSQVPAEALAGALVLYRLIYHVLPLLLALLLLGVSEVRRNAASPLQRVLASLSPIVLSGFTLVVGCVLLVSGATPSSDEVTELLSLHVPLPVVEAAHFISSLGGLALLFVARGLQRRLDAAWWAGLLIASASFLTAFPKGIALSEVALLTVLIGALLMSRGQFTRRTALLAEPLSGEWLLAMGGIVVCAIGVMLFVYKDTTYAHELWWQFEFDAHAPRSLRALVAAVIALFALAVHTALRPPRAQLDLPDQASMSLAQSIVSQQESADAGLVMMQDKHLLFSENQRAFIMFGRHGRSRVALFDPVGPREEWAGLIWSFIEQAREAGDRPSFYQVKPQSLPLYLDTGLSLFKLGEEAFVSLPDFSLKGPRRANLRQGFNRAERDGLQFEFVPVAEVGSVMAELEAVSDAWLAEHQASEKRFSLGAFSDAYVRLQPVVCIRHEGRMVAFATVMGTAQKAEISVDLMRHLPDAPRGTMDFLFVNLLLHCQAQGYARFSLGMAPLSGMAAHPLAPGWHRAGRLLFAHGEHFYNFQGLRAFKDKFDPEWEPRYLASPGGTTPLLVLADVAALIAGSTRGVFAK